VSSNIKLKCTDWNIKVQNIKFKQARNNYEIAQGTKRQRTLKNWNFKMKELSAGIYEGMRKGIQSLFLHQKIIARYAFDLSTFPI